MREKMLAIADRLEKRADAIDENLYRRWGPPDGPLPSSPVSQALRIMAEEINETLKTIGMIDAPTRNVDIMTIEDFTESCVAGALIDSDGFGRYGNLKKESSLPARPSRISGGDIDARWTHVYWYNK